MATYAVTIAGVSKKLQPGWTIDAPLNGIGRLSASVLSVDGAYIPALDAEVLITEDGTRIFGGNISSAFTRGVAGQGIVAIETDINADDFNDLANRRYYAGTLSGTLSSILTTLIGQLDGVTLHPSQVTGPTLASTTFSYFKVRDVLDQLTQMTGGYVWKIDYLKQLRMFLPGTLTAPFTVTTANRNAISDVTSEPSREQYFNAVTVLGNGVTGIAFDSAHIAARGTWETVLQSPDSTTQAHVDALAAAYLASSLPTPKTVTYQTDVVGLEPGQSQTITIAERAVNNTCLIVDVQTRALSANRVRRTVKAIEGSVYQSTWRDVVRSWGGGFSGETLPGAGSATVFQKYAYFLGGSGVDFVQSATPTWVDASPIHVRIDTAARGTTAATVTGRVRALSAGVSVQARLYDVTGGAPVTGSSAIVTSTAWTVVSFAVTLTAGARYYVLQLLPGAPNEDVGAVCYVE